MNVLKYPEIDFHLQHKLESDTHVVYSPYGKGEKAIVWSLLGLSVLLFVGNAVLTVKTYGDMTGKSTTLLFMLHLAESINQFSWSATSHSVQIHTERTTPGALPSENLKIASIRLAVLTTSDKKL